MKTLLILFLFFPILVFSQCDPVAGCINGKGIYTWDSGDIYNGEFKNGFFHGNGTYLYSNGNKYIGQWKNNKEHGKGVFTLSSGDKYEGGFKNGNFDGEGILTSISGDIYKGEFRDNQSNGYGILKYNNGDKYEGYWSENKFNGEGVYTYFKGDKYVGYFKDGLKSGEGTYTYTNRHIESGQWKDDKIWNGVYTFFSNKEGEEGLEINFFYNNGNIVDTLQNNINYFNTYDIIGNNKSDTILLVNKKTKYDIVLNINNVPVTWRFDTGAETTSISIDQWEKVKSKINYEDLNISRKTEGVGGFSNGRLVKITDEIQIGDYLVKNFIVSIANNKHSLLGIDFLQKFSNVKWNMNDASLILFK